MKDSANFSEMHGLYPFILTEFKEVSVKEPIKNKLH